MHPAHRPRTTALLLVAFLLAVAPALWAQGELEWMRTVERGRELLDAGQYEEARVELRRAWRASAAFPPLDDRAVETTRLYAEAHRLLGLNQRAEELHLAVLGTLSAALPDSDPRVVEQRRIVALMLRLRFQEDASRFQYATVYRALAGREGAEPGQLVRATYEYAGALARAGRNAEAAQLLEGVLDLVEDTFGPESEAYALILGDFGSRLADTGSLARARTALAESIRVFDALELASTRPARAASLRLSEVERRELDATRERELRELEEQVRARFVQMVTAPPAQPEPVDPFAADGWETIALFAGAESMATDSFLIPTDEDWRVTWIARPQGAMNWGLFTLELERPDSVEPTVVTSTTEETRATSAFRGRGDYRLLVTASNMAFQVGVQIPAGIARPGGPRFPGQSSGPPQQELIDTVARFSDAYAGAISSLERAALRSERATALRELFHPDYRATGYTGTIQRFGTAPNGSAYVSIALDGTDAVTARTWSTELADVTDQTLVAPGTAVFDTLMSLRVGQRVAFTGRFVPEPEGPDGLREASVSDVGSMSEPEFLVRLDRVAPL